MEQELIELLVASKRALSTGQSICAQANHFHQSSGSHVELMEKIHPKLLFVNNHILVQLSTLERIREYLTVQTDACKACIKVALIQTTCFMKQSLLTLYFFQDHETKLQTLSIELATIFDLLKQCTVDADIVSVNNEHDKKMESPVTLFDYISDQAIIELQRQADDEIGDIEVK
jgi:hypothetical protein